MVMVGKLGCTDVWPIHRLPIDDEVLGKGVQPSNSQDVKPVNSQYDESLLWVRIL